MNIKYCLLQFIFVSGAIHAGIVPPSIVPQLTNQFLKNAVVASREASGFLKLPWITAHDKLKPFKTLQPALEQDIMSLSSMQDCMEYVKTFGVADNLGDAVNATHNLSRRIMISDQDKQEAAHINQKLFVICVMKRYQSLFQAEPYDDANKALTQIIGSVQKTPIKSMDRLRYDIDGCREDAEKHPELNKIVSIFLPRLQVLYGQASISPNLQQELDREEQHRNISLMTLMVTFFGIMHLTK